LRLLLPDCWSGTRINICYSGSPSVTVLYIVQLIFIFMLLHSWLNKLIDWLIGHILTEVVVLMTETVMNGDAKSIHSHTDKLSWRVSFVTLGRITVSLPLGALFVCFVSAIIFQFDEVNQTVCQVCFPIQRDTFHIVDFWYLLELFMVWKHNHYQWFLVNFTNNSYIHDLPVHPGHYSWNECDARMPLQAIKLCVFVTFQMQMVPVE